MFSPQWLVGLENISLVSLYHRQTSVNSYSYRYFEMCVAVATF